MNQKNTLLILILVLFLFVGHLLALPLNSNTISMDNKEFWKIIEESYNDSNGNLEKQDSLIVEKLSNYTSQQIIEFEIILQSFINEADNYKVMAAEKIIEGDVSDDPYLYFRCWLISRGEKTYLSTLNNPDYLADKVNKSTNTWNEELLYVSTRAYILKTGNEIEDANFPREMAYKKYGYSYDDYPQPPKGDESIFNKLTSLYPKLCGVFDRKGEW